jgi:hypothetical protein
MAEQNPRGLPTVYFFQRPRYQAPPHTDGQGRTIVEPLWVAGRLDGLAGTVRYDLSDDDREAIKMGAALIRQAAALLNIDEPLPATLR